VMVYVPGAHATTRSAVYTVYAKAGSSTVTVDQATHHGQWVTPGTWQFGTTGTVRLTSATGEAVSTRRQVAFAAVRFVPVAVAAVTSAEPTPAPTLEGGVPAN
jgi:hypothetical protein